MATNFFAHLGTGRVNQRVRVLGLLDDGYCEAVDNGGLLHDMGGCIDAPEQLPAGGVYCAIRDPAVVEVRAHSIRR